MLLPKSTSRTHEFDLDFHNSPTNYATHGLHSFAAKCPPPLVEWIIKQWSKRGERVLDPMAGSGTTMVEAQLLGREALGVEIDPLARLLCVVKTTPLSAPELHHYGEQLALKVDEDCKLYDQGERSHVPAAPLVDNLEYWFLPEVSAKLALTKQAIAELDVPVQFQRFFFVAFSSLILSKTSVANARDIVHSRHHYYLHKTPPDVAALFRQKLKRMTKQMEGFVERLSQVTPTLPTQIIGHDARHLPLEDLSLDMVVTSPPYCNALDYTRAHKLAVGWLTDVLSISQQEYSALGRQYIGTERAANMPQAPRTGEALRVPLVQQIVAEISNLDSKKGQVCARYFGDMWHVIAEIGRVLRPGGYAALVVCPSNIRKILVPTHEAFVHMAQAMEFQALFRLMPVFLQARTISDRKRLMPYLGMEERMRLEYVLVFQKVAIT